MLSSKDREVYRRIVRDIEEGRTLEILSEEDYSKLKHQAEWSTQSPTEWQRLKALHYVRSGRSKSLGGIFGRLFGGARNTDQRLPLARASYLQMLAQSNEAGGHTWDYDAAKVWKRAVLDDASYRVGGFLGGFDPLETFRRRLPLVTIRARSGDAVQRGHRGAVTTFRWRKEQWGFKPVDDRCLAKVGQASGIPANGARMHDRSVAFYLLAKALGVERLVVETVHAFLETKQGLQYGSLMRRAKGQQPVTFQQRPDLVRQHLRKGYLYDEDSFRVLCHRPHLLGSLTEEVLCCEALLRDLFSAAWLDYLAAQMDRALTDLHVDIAPGSGKYQGLQLINNEICFGTVTDPQKLREIKNSKNKGLPGYVPAELAKRITEVARGLPGDASGFWRQARGGAPSDKMQVKRQGPPSEGHEQPKQELDLVELAKLLGEQEFVALTKRFRTAAAAVPKGRKVVAGSGKELKTNFSEAKKKSTVHEFSLSSYWHELYWMTASPEQFKKIRANPREMSHAEFVRRLQGAKDKVRPPLLSHALQLTSKQKDKLQPTTGLPTVAFLEELFKTGKGRALNPKNAAVRVEALKRSGAATGALFGLSLGTERYLIKTPARCWEMDGGTWLIATSAKRPVLVGDPEVEHYAKIAAKNVLWQTRTFTAPDETRLTLALPLMTLTYTVTASVSVRQGQAAGDPREMVAKHQICVLPLAKGVRVADLLEEQPERLVELMGKLGSAIGALHKHFAVKQVLPTGGHRTYVHGDFYGSNIFYDEHEDLVTLIDLTPMAFNFIGPKACCGHVDGHDMLHDLARLFTMTLQGELWKDPHKQTREAVYKGYLASFPDLKATEIEKKLQALRKNPTFIGELCADTRHLEAPDAEHLKAGKTIVKLAARKRLAKARKERLDRAKQRTRMDYKTKEISIEGLPQGLKMEMLKGGKWGDATEQFLLWLIKQGRILNLDPKDKNLAVKYLTKGGTFARGIFAVYYRTRTKAPLFIIKESGYREGNAPVSTVLAKGKDGVFDQPAVAEARDLAVVSASPIGSLGTLQCPGGVQLRVSLEEELFSYVIDLKNGARVRHHLVVLHAARGKVLQDLREAGGQAALQAFKAAGAALGALHRRFSKGKTDKETNFGLLTLVHGDFYPRNVFYDDKRKLVGLIDVAQMAKSVESGNGLNMMIDVKRMYEVLKKQSSLQNAFLEGYVENFASTELKYLEAKKGVPSIRAFLASTAGKKLPRELA